MILIAWCSISKVIKINYGALDGNFIDPDEHHQDDANN
jgi:hypothetical protein